MASLSSGLRPTDAFITSTLQKHLFREMKLSDTAVKNPEILKWNNMNKRYAPSAREKGGEHDDDDPDDDDGPGGEPEVTGERANLPEIPKKNNPVIIAIYGQICIAAKSYQSAICE